jgi:Bifunctional DNA primase/polymerase, N-terminal
VSTPTFAELQAQYNALGLPQVAAQPESDPFAFTDADKAEFTQVADVAAPATLTFFESIALPLVSRGWKVAPCYPRSKQVNGKLVQHPLEQMTNDPAQVHAWGLVEPDANVCVYAKQEEGGLLFLDKDGAISLREKYKQETGKDFPETLLVRSSIVNVNGVSIEKGHWYFAQTPKTMQIGNITEVATGGLFSLRVHNLYVASIGSIHPVTGKPYAIAEDYPVVPMPDDLLEWLLSLDVSGASKTKSEKGQKMKSQLVPGTTRFEAVPAEADPAFKKLFDEVGWEPFEQRVRKMADARFHNFTLTDKLSFCPMPGHAPRGPEVPFTSKIFGTFGNGDVVHCFGCTFGGDMVKAVYTFDAGEEGGKISYGNMYECARVICKEQGLDPAEYFPQKGVSAEPTEEQKKESGEHRLEFSEDTEVIPAFDPSVINGIYAKFVELMTRGTTLVPQYAFLAAKTYIGLRLAGKVTFATVDAQPRYFGVAIGETGSGKGAAYSRLLQILHACGSLKGSPGMIKIMNGVDSGSGLKDFFFEDPQDEGVLVYIDEAATYANKATATRNPSALDDLLELVDQTAISRTLSVGLGKKKSKKKNDAYLAMYMCAQDGDVLQRLFAGRGKLGALDRLTPEYSVAVKPGRMPEISPSDAMRVFGEVTAMIEAAKGKTIGIQPEAEALLESFWESQSSTTQTKVRWKKYIQVDAYMSAFGLGRDTVTLEDMQIAIRIFERQLILRRAFFKNMDVTDKVGYYLAKCKVITEWMLVQQAAGKAEWTYAQSKRDYETKTHAFREHEEAYFEKAWILHSKGRLSEIRVKKSNGHEYVKYIPTPEEPAD